MNSDRMTEGGRDDGKKFRKTVLGGRTCCCLSEPSWGAVTSNVVLYANRRHQTSYKSGKVHSNSGSTDEDNESAISQQKRTATAMPSA
jgi:hypothetical protein